MQLCVIQQCVMCCGPPGCRIFNVLHVNVRRASSCCSLVDCCAAVAAMRRKWGLGIGDEQQCSACGAAHGCATLWSSTRTMEQHTVWSSTRMCIVCFGQLSVECPPTCDTCVKLQSVILKDCRHQKHLPRVVQGKGRN